MAELSELDSLKSWPMRIIACTDGVSLGISETECVAATRSSDGIADDHFPPTDARVEIRINTSQARMMSSENLCMVRAMKGGRGLSELMPRSLVPQQQGTHERAGTYRPKQCTGRAGTHSMRP